MIIPARLQPGDCIGIFSPAGPVRDPDKVDAGISLLQNMGFRVKQAPGSDSENEYLAADDQERVDSFHSLLADDTVDALMALRGGYGCLRIADQIDFKLIADKKKLIIGFSDICVLLNAVNSFSDMISVHGPVLTSLAASDTETIKSLFSLLTNVLPRQIVPDDIAVLRPGTAKGILRGGNLATIIHLLGTPWEIPFAKTLLLLEDTGEPMYKIDRMLTQLHQGGRLQKLAGIIIGQFDMGDDPDTNRALEENVWKRVLELTDGSSFPVWGNFPSGHREKNIALPFGATVTMEKTKTLVFEEN